MLISYSSVRKRLEVKKKKIRPKLRYECEYNQIFATCSSLKKKKKKRVSGILKREPCQIWISEVETVIATDWTHRVTSKYTYLIRENGINFLNQREESGLREREREREDRKEKRRWACVCICIQYEAKVFCSKEKFEFCYCTILPTNIIFWNFRVSLNLRFQISRNVSNNWFICHFFIYYTDCYQKSRKTKKISRSTRIRRIYFPESYVQSTW